ncbi:hypothetical protein R3P38DRAFT_1257525 [Favolaschia claudopus]|uniref:Uncharacterized protein n=1 Tax=Favolaschia claudopus TaxID=2862362 RepID=A0AAW0B092_9AGAR
MDRVPASNLSLFYCSSFAHFDVFFSAFAQTILPPAGKYPPPTHKAASIPPVLLDFCCCRRSRGAHSFEYMDRRPASGTFNRRQANPPPTRIAAVSTVICCCCTRRLGRDAQRSYSFDTTYRPPASGSSGFCNSRQVFLTSVGLDEVSVSLFFSPSPSRVPHVDYSTYRRPAAGEFLISTRSTTASKLDTFSFKFLRCAALIPTKANPKSKFDL